MLFCLSETIHRAKIALAHDSPEAMKLNARGQAAGNMGKLVDRAQHRIYLSHGKGKERQGVICLFLTSLCPVAGEKVRVGLLSHPPGNACAHDTGIHVS